MELNIEKIVTEASMNHEQKKYRDSWQSEVDKHDWKNMDKKQYKLTCAIVWKDFSKNNLTSKQRSVIYRSIFGLLFVDMIICLLFLFTLYPESGEYLQSWHYARDLHSYLNAGNNIFILIYAMVLSSVIFSIIFWFNLGSFYAKGCKNLSNYLRSKKSSL